VGTVGAVGAVGWVVGRGQMARVLILGGGFGGFYTALGLERLLPRGRHEVTLVSNENYLLYTPLLPEAAAGALERVGRAREGRLKVGLAAPRGVHGGAASMTSWLRRCSSVS